MRRLSAVPGLPGAPWTQLAVRLDCCGLRPSLGRSLAYWDGSIPAWLLGFEGTIPELVVGQALGAVEAGILTGAVDITDP
jgi:hypothetical protein